MRKGYPLSSTWPTHYLGAFAPRVGLPVGPAVLWAAPNRLWSFELLSEHHIVLYEPQRRASWLVELTQV
jgi:hypothetical protein